MQVSIGKHGMVPTFKDVICEGVLCGCYYEGATMSSKLKTAMIFKLRITAMPFL
jgi:hypothetical protein